MSSVRKSIFVISLVVMLAGLSCKTGQKTDQDLSNKCCQECIEAFSQSPVGVGAAGVKCGEFTTGKPISQACQDYFKNNPKTVAECE